MEIQIYSVPKASMNGVHIYIYLPACGLKIHGCYVGRNLPLVNTLSGCNQNLQ